MSRFKRNFVFACFISVLASMAIFRVAYDTTVETAESEVVQDDSVVAHGGHGGGGHHGGHHSHHGKHHGGHHGNHQGQHHNHHHNLDNNHGWHDHGSGWEAGYWNGGTQLNGVAPTVEYQTLPDYQYYVPATTTPAGTSGSKAGVPSAGQHK